MDLILVFAIGAIVAATGIINPESKDTEIVEKAAQNEAITTVAQEAKPEPEPEQIAAKEPEPEPVPVKEPEPEPEPVPVKEP